ncbi:peptidase S8/S53 domain-containing protein [Stachybotrys elegans]|uniref:Peptidase S8/S53 domain-containing protein n=1 Tax=Stachybotrys elegans TaxID=80388 RepID=A0A8K0SCQ0_9HYPO|nr:peptidase S8/S53 domain-containing protein [Stachybotrys elegans]
MHCSAPLLSLLVATLCAVVAAESGTEKLAIGSPKVIPGRFLVEFDDDYNNDQFRVQAEPEYETRVELRYTLFRGVSIQLNDVDTAEEKAVQLASLPSVKNIWPVYVIELPELELEEVVSAGVSAHSQLKRSGKTSLSNAPHVMTQIDKMHAEGITGKGIKIAVIDSGIEYTHPALGGCFGEGCLVTSGYDFVGDDFTGYNNAMPDNDPMDCRGHGTHVAGIISAQENEFGIFGAAPGAVLSAYRVFGCTGVTTSDIIIAAYNAAYEDGADIITASLSARSGWSSSHWNDPISRIVERGIPCLASAGNTGDSGLFDVGNPGAAKGVTAVASFENTVRPTEQFKGYHIIDKASPVSFPIHHGRPGDWDGVERPLWATGYNLSTTVDGCEPLSDDTPDLSQYVVLLRRADCSYSDQAQNVADKGAKFLIIYNNEPGFNFIFLDGIEGIQGVAGISMELGETWIKALEAGSTVMTDILASDNPERYFIFDPDYDEAGTVSYWSSMGPSYEMNAGPNFGAPGGAILSTVPVSQGSFGVKSGTSMACPLAAAAYALIAEARGKLEPAVVADVLASTAKAQAYYNIMDQTFEDWLTSPVQQGAGLIQVYDAAHATTLVTPTSLSFNDADHFIETLNFTLTNSAKNEISYDLLHTPSRSLYVLEPDGIKHSTWDVGNVNVHAEILISSSRVVVGPGESTTIEVTAIPPQGLDLKRMPLWSGYISINGSDGSSLSLTYQGLQGSLYNATVIRDDDLWIASSSAWTLDPVPDNTIFTLPPPGTPWSWEYNYPLVIMTLHWGSRIITADIVPLTTCPPNTTIQARGMETIGQLVGYPQLWSPHGETSVTWEGSLADGLYAPPGRYKVVVRALRIHGNESEDEDWFMAESQPFQIKYLETVGGDDDGTGDDAPSQ